MFDAELNILNGERMRLRRKGQEKSENELTAKKRDKLGTSEEKMEER